MNTDFTIRIAQQSDALELMSLFQETGRFPCRCEGSQNRAFPHRGEEDA